MRFPDGLEPTEVDGKWKEVDLLTKLRDAFPKTLRGDEDQIRITKQPVFGLSNR